MTVPGRQGRRPLLWDRVYCIKFIICNKAKVHGTMRASSPTHGLQVRGSIFTFLPGAMRASRPTEHFIVYRTFSSTIKPKATKAPDTENLHRALFQSLIKLLLLTQAFTWEAATAQATVMPTIGLLPAPIRPIIST